MYMNQILAIENFKMDKWVRVVDSYELFERLKEMFYQGIWKDSYEEILMSFIEKLNRDEKTRIFYVNNFVEFTRRHYIVQDVYDNLFSHIKNYDYPETEEDIPKEFLPKLEKFEGKKKIKECHSLINKEYFMDPNSPPDSIIMDLAELRDIYLKYVYLPFMSFDRIHRLKYFERKTVVVVDTDSNIMTLDDWVDFCENEVLRGNYGRSDEFNRFAIINTMTYIMTAAIADVLNEYGIHSFIPKEFRPKFGMKNEFYMTKLVVGKKKKRYISAIRLREGNLITPYKPDVKGFEFRKATTSTEAKAIFDEIVRKHILESRVPNIIGILQDLKDFEDQIRNSILNGETTYLPLGNAKDLEAYKDPYSQQGVRGSIAWNIIYPDNQISFPSKVSLLKLNIFDVDDMENLQYTNPQIYNSIRQEIFNSPVKGLSSKGLQVLAIPSNSKIPEWCMDYIDMNTIINNIIGQFKGVLDTFGIDCPEVGKQVKTVNRKTKKFSNIVRF